MREGRRHAPLGLVVAVVAVLVAGCESVTVSFSPSAPPPIPTPLVTTYGLNTSVWYAGLKITFNTATSVLTSFGGTLSVDVQFQNPGSDDQTLAAPIELVLGSNRVDPEHGTTMPNVPAAGTSEIPIVYDVVGQSSIDGATIVVGNGGDNQASVALTDPSKAVSLAPIQVFAPGVTHAADLQVVMDSAEVRWDLPDWGDELPSGHVALTLTYDAVYRGTFSGGLAFTAATVSLVLPDGSTIEPRKDGHSQTNAVLLPGKAQTQMISRFELPALEHGRYVFVIQNSAARGSIAFTIKG